jgi:hypothetical protein
MFLVDDIILEAAGIRIPGMDLLWTFERVMDMALKELYDPEKIRNSIKENRLLFEFGELTSEEYGAREAALRGDLETAERIEEMCLRSRCDILGAR